MNPDVPMTLMEWSNSTGALLAVTEAAEENPDGFTKTRDVGMDAGEDEDMTEVRDRVLGAYHAYICAFIAAMKGDDGTA